MANGLIDPVYRILPSKVDAIRRSWDPTGQLGVDEIEAGHLTVHGRALTLRRSLPTSVRGHLTVTGRTAVIRRTLPILPGHLQLAGKNLEAIVQLQWLTIPRFDINWGAVTYPHVIPGTIGIRANYLIGTAQTVTLGGIDVGQIVYEEGNDRIVVLSNPGIDVVDSVYMVADGLASNTFQIALVNPISYPIWLAETRTVWEDPSAFDSVPTLVLHPGDYYGQVGPLSNPAAVTSFQLGDNGYMKIDFALSVTGGAAPSMVNSIQASTNGTSLSVPISTLPSIASGQGLLMLWSGAQGPLTSDPTTQGWTHAGTLTQASTAPDIQVFWKIAAASNPNVTCTHGGGRQGVIVSNWTGMNATTFVDALAQFITSTANLFQTPSITPTQGFTTVISFLSNGANPTFSSQPATYTLIRQFAIQSNFFLGAAYKKQTSRVATGVLDWSMTNVGGSKAGATLALRGVQPTSSYSGFTVPMRHHTNTGPGEDTFGNTFWTMQVLPPPVP